MEIYIIISVVFFIGVLVFVAIRFSKIDKRKNEQMLSTVAQDLGATLQLGNWKTQPVILGEMRETPFVITFRVVQSGNAQVTYLELRTPFSSPDIQVSVKKHGGGAKLLEKVGLSRHVETGDSAFDSEVLVKGKPEGKVQALAYDYGFKNVALHLTKRGYSIEVKPPSAVATKAYNRKKDLVSQVLREDIEALLGLVRLCR